MKKQGFITISGELCLITLIFESMSTTQVYISVKKRRGQRVKWSHKENRPLRTCNYNAYSTLSFTATNSDFDNCQFTLEKYIRENISFTRYIDFDSSRVSYELLRALA